MSNPINLAIQILPMSVEKSQAYSAIDAAIQLVEKSGLKYVVCPFETVIEGEYDIVMNLVKEMQESVFDNHVEHILVNIKIQRSKSQSVRIEDKIEKYQ